MTRDSQLDKLTVKELRELRERIDRVIGKKQVDGRRELRDEFRKLAEEQGFTLADFAGGARGGKGRPVAAKYMNPADSSETWSGRGRPPRWLAAKVKAGAKFEDFSV